MSRITILPIDFLGQGAMLEPANPKLHDLAVEFCKKELAEGLNLARLQKIWLALDGENAVGFTGFVSRIDIPVFRTAGPRGPEVAIALIARLRSYFQDQGLRGAEIFVHISSDEQPEQRCAKWRETLKFVGAKPADRWLVEV